MKPLAFGRHFPLRPALPVAEPTHPEPGVIECERVQQAILAGVRAAEGSPVFTRNECRAVRIIGLFLQATLCLEQTLGPK